MSVKKETFIKIKDTKCTSINTNEIIYELNFSPFEECVLRSDVGFTVNIGNIVIKNGEKFIGSIKKRIYTENNKDYFVKASDIQIDLEDE